MLKQTIPEGNWDQISLLSEYKHRQEIDGHGIYSGGGEGEFYRASYIYPNTYVI